MDADSLSTRLSSTSKRYQSTFHTRSDMFMGFEEIDGDDDIREEFPCPFCSAYFDIFGLCIHLDDEHPLEAKNGVCPVCAMRAGADMVAHISLQHGNIFKMQQKRKSRKSVSHSAHSFFKREPCDGTPPSLLGGSSCVVSSSNNSAPDPLLSLFILPVANDFAKVELKLSTETNTNKKSLDEDMFERYDAFLYLLFPSTGKDAVGLCLL
ncbi:hypothetical protein SAY87_011010 [Trapa incisa]|uniref:Uncharacterized protein n=1 Tax=Trapa incisa TaxID=236973 RepID=A0AAN7JIU8_9MYRT|nr:hypothetical protein SAY87_011010 [Trapa incisa]